MIVGALFCLIYVSIDDVPPWEHTHFTKWLIKNLGGESQGATRAPGRVGKGMLGGGRGGGSIDARTPGTGTGGSTCDGEA